MSRKLRFEWDVPETLFDDGFPEETFLEQVKQDAVVRLFIQGRISSGYAASLLGLRRRDFFEFLQRQGLPFVQYTAADWEEEHQSLREVEGKRWQEQSTTEHEG
jgi:predicted HTH domain antitoxin